MLPRLKQQLITRQLRDVTMARMTRTTPALLPLASVYPIGSWKSLLIQLRIYNTKR